MGAKRAGLRVRPNLGQASGLPVAVLFQIPNQPIGGREEDDLIAHTFEQFFMTGDPTWPLLFPRVKSVIRTMDALEQSTKGADDPLTKFVLTGASKRGWTAWLAGAIDDDRIGGYDPFHDRSSLPRLDRRDPFARTAG